MLQRISIPPTTASDWWCTKAISDVAKRDANNLHRDSQWTPRSMRPGILTWLSFQFSNVSLVISEPQKRGTFRYVICRQKSKGVTPKTQNPRMYKLHQSMQFIHLQLSTARNLFPQASRAVSKTWDASTINDPHQAGAKTSPKATKWKCLGALPNATSTVTGTKLTSSTCFNWGGLPWKVDNLTEESTYN